MQKLIAATLLATSLVSAETPDEQTVQVRREVIANLIMRAGALTDPLPVVDIQPDPAATAALPIHVVRQNDLELRLPLADNAYRLQELREYEFAACIAVYGSATHVDIRAFDCGIDTLRSRIRNRDPYSLLTADDVFSPLLGQHVATQPRWTAASRAIAHHGFTYFGQEAYDHLVETITLDSLVQSSTSVGDEEFLVYASAYYAAANLDQLSTTLEFETVKITTQLDGRSYFYPVVLRDETCGANHEYLTYHGMYSSPHSDASAMIYIFPDLASLEEMTAHERRELMFAFTHTAESLIEQAGLNEPVVDDTPSP